MAAVSRWASLSSAVESVLEALFGRRRRERAVPPRRFVEALEGRRLLSVSVNLGATSSIDEGDTITLSLSALENGSTTLAVSSWTIDWGDALAAPENTTNTSPSHTYLDGDDDHDIIVTAHISDPYNNIYGDYQGSSQIEVQNVDAFVFAYGDSSVSEDSDYTVSAYYSDVGDDHVISWTINWGDGTSDNVPADGSSMSYTHRFDQAGVQRTVTVTANDEDGSYSAGYPVSVTNVDPGVSTSVGGYAPFREGTDTVYVNGSYSHPGDGVTGWIIDWGNGSMSGGPGNPITGNQLAMGLVYPDDGEFTISISVSDDDGRSFSFEHQIGIDNIDPEIELGGDDEGLRAGDSFTLTASTSDPGADTISGWSIDWGDGKTTTHSGNPGAFAHTYATPGTFTISATATDEDGSYAETYEAAAAAGEIDALTVFESSFPTKSATATYASSGPDLYIEEIAGGASIQASSDPSASELAGIRWRVLRGGAVLADRPMGGAAVSVTAAGGRDFVVQGGVDANGDGDLADAGEATRTVNVHLVRIDGLLVRDKTTNAVVSNPSDLDMLIWQTDAVVPIELRAEFALFGNEAGAHILWDVSGGPSTGPATKHFGSGMPTVNLQPTTTARQYVVRMGFDNNGNGTLQVPDEVDRTITVHVVKAQVDEVTFSATDANRFFPVIRDDGGAYPSLHWKAGRSEQSPVAYRRQATMKLDAKINLLGAPGSLSMTGDTLVKGENAYGHHFWGKLGANLPDDGSDYLSYSSGTLSFGNEASDPFPNWIDHFDTFDIAWSVSLDDGVTWVPAGTSQNQVYTFLDTPISTLYHTVAHLATDEPKGTSTEATAIPAIFSEFEDLAVRRVDGQLMVYSHEDESGHRAFNAAPGYYSLLTHPDGEGQCTAWAELLKAVFEAHGIEAQLRDMWNSNAGLRFQVFDVPAQGTGGANYDAETQFNFHQIVMLDGKIYDPSYGVGPLASATDVELLYEQLYVLNFESAPDVWPSPASNGPAKQLSWGAY